MFWYYTDEGCTKIMREKPAPIVHAEWCVPLTVSDLVKLLAGASVHDIQPGKLMWTKER